MGFKDEILGASLDVDLEAGASQVHNPASTHLLVGGKGVPCIERLTSVGAMALSIRQCLLSGKHEEIGRASCRERV